MLPARMICGECRAVVPRGVCVEAWRVLHQFYRHGVSIQPEDCRSVNAALVARALRWEEEETEPRCGSGAGDSGP